MQRFERLIFFDMCPLLNRALQTLPEKEARAIIAQVFSALVYLNHPSHVHRVIHYDLKVGLGFGAWGMP